MQFTEPYMHTIDVIARSYVASANQITMLRKLSGRMLEERRSGSQ